MDRSRNRGTFAVRPCTFRLLFQQPSSLREQSRGPILGPAKSKSDVGSIGGNYHRNGSIYDRVSKRPTWDGFESNLTVSPAIPGNGEVDRGWGDVARIRVAGNL